jgi:hypothetical protein
MSIERLRPSSNITGWTNIGPSLQYESLTFTATATISLTGNGSTNVDAFKTSGSFAWDAQAYSLTPFTAPCTIEFNKWSANNDNGRSYAMIGWNTDPTTNPSYDTLDYASYPYAMSNYQVYNNGTLVHNSGTWSRTLKFYIVYGTDGFIRHYNGSTELYSVNWGNATTTFYVDSSIYAVGSTFAGFSNIRVIKMSWNGTRYI